jgi:hypothetical protein
MLSAADRAMVIVFPCFEATMAAGAMFPVEGPPPPRSVE